MPLDTPIFTPPESNQDRPAWRRELAVFRAEARARLRYDDTLYLRPEFQWASTNFACCLAMMFDTRFYDARRGCWLLEEFLSDGDERLGGYDSLVLWHAYPRIGFDARNQFDFYRQMPGGIEGLAQLTRKCHEKGVRVFVDYNPWDTATRREGRTDEAAMVDIVRGINVDGVFLDTLAAGRQGWRQSLDSARPGVILESELALPLEAVATHHASWAQGFGNSGVADAPGVLRNKWFERRHMMHVINRFRPRHWADIHTAWMNGVGIIAWENVFGTTMPMVPHDASLLRAMLPIQRRFAALFTSEEWTPLVDTGCAEVSASLWERGGTRLWTLANRAASPRHGAILELPRDEGLRWFNLITGEEVSTRGQGMDRRLELNLRAEGIGAILAVPHAQVDAGLLNFLQRQGGIDASFDANAQAFAVKAEAAAVPVVRVTSLPARMVRVEAYAGPQFVAYRERECGFPEEAVTQRLTPAVMDQLAEGVRTGLPEFGSVSGGNLHQAVVGMRSVRIAAFAIDLTPVTNAQFAEFLHRSGYQPGVRENFLRHWINGAPPSGLENHPVVYVDLNDANAYARWAGKRLPTDEEWQLASQDGDHRLYPWGSQWLFDRCNAAGAGTTDVMRYPLGRSPCGCYDMIGNTWEWTHSERDDGRTRYCLVRGGSYYRAASSDWYADGGPRYCNFAAKFVLIWPGLDRCETIGFRCAADL